MPIFQVSHTIDMHQTIPTPLHGEPTMLENHPQFVSTSLSQGFLPSMDLSLLSIQSWSHSLLLPPQIPK